MTDWENAVIAELRGIRAALERPKRERASLAPDAELIPAYSEAFLAFWAGYTSPRRRNKPAAWREWRRLRLDGRSEMVECALDLFRQSRQWQEGFEPEPARWLKSEPWQDEPTAPEAGHPMDEDEWTPRGKA